MKGKRWFDVVRSGTIALVGSIDYRIEFATEVRSLILNEKPDVICVELPLSLRENILEGVRHLPYHSVIIYGNEANQYSGFIVEGSDGVFEAVRSGIELGVPVWFLDPVLSHRHGSSDKLPDSFTIDIVGQNTCFNSQLGSFLKLKGNVDNTLRLTFMASRLQAAARNYAKVLFVCRFGSI